MYRLDFDPDDFDDDELGPRVPYAGLRNEWQPIRYGGPLTTANHWLTFHGQTKPHITHGWTVH